MRNLFENRLWVLFVSVLALVALTALAIGLRTISFRAGEPFGVTEAEPPAPPPAPLESMPDVPVQSHLIVWIALLLLVVLIGILLTPELRKRLLRVFLRVAFTYWVLYFVLTRYSSVLASLAGILNLAPQGGPASNSDNIPPPVFTPPPETPWLSYLVAVTCILLVAFFAWRTRGFWRNYAGQGSGKSLDEIVRIARSSLRDLSSGRESTDVIMNCYFRMSDVVADKRSLKRGTSMTPAEFAVRLERAGLPADAVKRLTRLFENVRYGGYRTGPKEVNEAVACLTTILNYCGEPV